MQLCAKAMKIVQQYLSWYIFNNTMKTICEHNEKQKCNKPRNQCEAWSENVFLWLAVLIKTKHVSSSFFFHLFFESHAPEKTSVFVLPVCISTAEIQPVNIRLCIDRTRTFFYFLFLCHDLVSRSAEFGTKVDLVLYSHFLVSTTFFLACFLLGTCCCIR